ncbi:hypothetical protein CBL_14356 [Carabus blaptoides fortunei]
MYNKETCGGAAKYMCPDTEAPGTPRRMPTFVVVLCVCMYAHVLEWTSAHAPVQQGMQANTSPCLARRVCMRQLTVGFTCAAVLVVPQQLHQLQQLHEESPSDEHATTRYTPAFHLHTNIIKRSRSFNNK